MLKVEHPFRALLFGALAIAAPALGIPQAAQAGPQLAALTKAVNPCIALGRPAACPAAPCTGPCQGWSLLPGAGHRLWPGAGPAALQDVIPQTVQASLTAWFRPAVLTGCKPSGRLGSRFAIQLCGEAIAVKAAAQPVGDRFDIGGAVAQAAGPAR